MPNKRRKQIDHSDHSLLEMALVGYKSAKDAIDQRMSAIRRMIGGGGRAIVAAVETYTTPRKRRTLSAKARAITMAQKKRWSDAKRAATAKAKSAKKKVKKAVLATKRKAA